MMALLRCDVCGGVESVMLLVMFAVRKRLPQVLSAFCLTPLFFDELHNAGHASVELPFHDLSLDFVAKNHFTIWKLHLGVHCRYQHIGVFWATSVPRQLRL